MKRIVRGALLQATWTGDKPKASDTREQLVLCDLDFDPVLEVRNAWQFYRDHRPEMYAGIADPAAS